MPHKQRNNTTKLLIRTHSPHLGQVGSNRKQVIHLFVLRSHENICFYTKIKYSYSMLQLFFFPVQVSSSMTTKPLRKKKKSTRLVLVKGLLRIIHVRHLAKTTDTLQQRKIHQSHQSTGRRKSVGGRVSVGREE